MEKRKPRFKGTGDEDPRDPGALGRGADEAPARDQHRARSREAALLLVDLETEEGIVGRSYLFGIGQHNLAPIAKLVEAMAAMVKGDEVAPLDLERKLRAKYALLGVHNIVLFAMSGIDMAAWDALAQALGRRSCACSARRRGRSRPTTPRAWASCRAKSWRGGGELVEEGFRAVKLRLGRPDAQRRSEGAAAR